MNDDSKKNGLKPYVWGPSYWTMLHAWSWLLSAGDARLLEFFYLSPRHLLPCVHCRQSYEKFSQMPAHDLRTHIRTRRLPEYVFLVHNAVNRKLGKPLQTSVAVGQQRRFLQTWEQHFWFWLECLAFNFPADACCPLPRAHEHAHAEELRQRVRTYVLFFELLKNLLPPHSSLAASWSRAYFADPPTLWTFSSRSRLLRWLYAMEQQCGHRQTDQCSFVEFLEELHPIRSSA